MKRQISPSKRAVLFVTAIFLLTIFSTVLVAQTGSASIRGIVADPKGEPVAGATVTLSNAQRNFSRTQSTNDQGAYLFTAIPPGTYQLEVEATGFKRSSLSDVEALVETHKDIDIRLEVGAISETVNVTTGTEAPLNTTDATIGNTFESRRITELPLNARNVVGLLSLQPGVTRGGTVNGGRADQSNITLDGVDVNEQQRGIDVVTDEAFARARNFAR